MNCKLKILPAVSKISHASLASFCLVFTLLFIQTTHGNAAAGDSKLMLPKSYDDQKLNGEWLWSEKLDGIRGEWTGTEMRTKQGNPIKIPAYFTENFPPFPLSGEIWGGRQTFQQTVSIVTTEKEDTGWDSLKYGIFDSPDKTLTIEQRLKRAKEWFKTHSSRYAFVIEQKPLADANQLQAILDEIEKGGGEGIVLVQKGSIYQSGRSARLLKVKNFRDAEAVVVGYIPGQGKHQGRMGALKVKLLQNRNITFRIGTGFSDQERITPPPIGSIITFKYNGYYDSGKPRFPSFLRIRSLTPEIM